MTEKKRIGGWLVRIIIALSSLNAGCAAVGPDYLKPHTELSPQWHAELQEGLSSAAPDPARLAIWWGTMGDPLLSNLVERGIAGNLDLKKAKSRLRESRANRGIARAELFPKIDASANYTRSLGSTDTSGGGEFDLHSAGFDASWELDLFGGKRRSVEAAQGDLQAAHEDLRDVLVSLTAEVALNYVSLRTAQARLAVAEENLDSQDETFRLTRSRARAGLGSELAVQQARYNVESTRSEVPSLRAEIEDYMNRLAVLLGMQAGALHLELKRPGGVPVPPLEIAVGVPADILRQRPDVRRAERQLAAQTARVGVAVAELYPKLTLNGSIGLEALSISDIFLPGNHFFTFGPALSIPIFRAGALRSNIEVQSALQEQALITYESSILTAVEEVENAISAYAEEQSRRGSLEEASDAAKQAVLLADCQYKAGQIDFSNVLEAQRSLLGFQDKLAQSNGAVTTNLIRLYKALGGGWTPLAPESAKDTKNNGDDNRGH